jgi:hypothetical protein
MLMILSNFFALLRKLAEIFQQTRLLNAGRAEAIAEQTKETTDAILKANEVRDSVHAANAGVVSTDGLPDDGFRRD